MHYPWWYVPALTAPMLIAVIAVIHVIVSHYAVGGGILLALENQFAVKTGNTKYRDYLHKHAQFFVLLTVAFGAITGVGIWWTIALTSPLATEMLIREFVFGWAIEWVFFIIEIVAAFIMYYQWTKLPPKTHIIITWIYAAAAWISLVLITGITAFMLDSRGLIANWSETGNFWHAFFNLQFLPQTITRTGGALLLAALYVFCHCTWTFRQENKTAEEQDIFDLTIRRSSRYIITGAVLIVIGFGWGLLLLRPEVFSVMERAVLINVLVSIIFGVCALLALGVAAFPLFNPRSVNFGFALSLFIFGIIALAASEFAREAIRKPWIVDQAVLGSQILKQEVQDRQKNGYLRDTAWQKIPADKKERGGMVFMYHCNNCHAAEHGMSAAGPLLLGLNKEKIADKMRNLNESVISMPPWAGTEDELDCLSEYLVSIRPERP
ncbi:hypothetical protein FACS189427_03920 [Planctomycetales bacterium]|nr:hypothetical protein FACS189427_03920 [Planctomycetales bacterium]